MQLNEITEKIISSLFKVSNTLGCGFLEKVYVKASAIEVRKTGLDVKIEAPLPVKYEGVLVGEYFVDMLVENLVLVEFKAVQVLDTVHTAQCLNYLLASGLPVCLLVNFFRPKLEIKRLAANPAWVK